MCNAGDSEQLRSVLTLNDDYDDDDDDDDDGNNNNNNNNNNTIVVITKEKLMSICPCDILNYFDYKLKYFIN